MSKTLQQSFGIETPVCLGPANARLKANETGKGL